MGKDRLLWADALKGWLILLVILGHAIQTTIGDDCFHNHLWNIIYSFHMPAFMAVSGYFAFRQSTSINIVNHIKRRSMQLLIPYIIWSIFAFLRYETRTFDKFFDIIMDPDAYYWFLYVLFWISVLFSAAQWVARRINADEIVVIILVSIILMAVMVIFECRIMGFQFIAYYFLFYSAGYAIHRYSSFFRLSNILVIFLSCVWVFMAWNWNMHELPSWLSSIQLIPTTFLQYVFRGVTAIIAIVLILTLSPKVFKNGGGRLIQKLGELSLGIYIVHLILMGPFVRYIQGNYNIPNNSCIFLSFSYSLLSIGIVYLLSKNKISAKYLLGKL